MSFLTILFVCLSLLTAGLLGISLSVPLQAPAVILMGMAAVCAALKGVSKRGSERAKANSKRLQFWWLALVFVAIIFFTVRAWLSPVRDMGIEDLMLILPAAILYLLAGHMLGGKHGVKLRLGMAAVVILLLLLHVGACLMQLLDGEGYSLAVYFLGASRVNADHVTGMYGYYGSFANFAVIAGLLGLSLGIWGRFARSVRIMLLVVGATALTLAVWSQSRSAVLSLCAAMVVFVILLNISAGGQTERVKKRIRLVLSWFGILGLTAAVIGAFWVFAQRGMESFAAIFDYGVRVPFWAMAAEQWTNYPWIGAGSRSFSYECFLYWSPSLSTGERNPEFVHNEYLQLLADYGLVGFLLIMSLLALHGMAGMKTVNRLCNQVGEEGFKRGSNAMALAIAGLAGMVAMAVHICFDFRAHLQANLLLFVCCAIWLLPLPRVWSKAGSQTVAAESRQYTSSWFISLILLAMGLASIGLGCQQLWAGMPLLEHRITKEDGAWKPQAVDRKVWIPALEKSLIRAPQWRRSQRLATLYRLEASDAESADEMKDALKKAEEAYLASIERHELNPISRINLASIYMMQGRWDEADKLYASASERAKAREALFGMHALWGELHLTIALDCWEEGSNEKAGEHFMRAKSLFELSRDVRTSAWKSYWGGNIFWGEKYTQCLLAYADFLDDESSYAKAEELYSLAKEIPYWYSHQQETRVNFYHARHYFRHGQKLWHERKPGEAYQMMRKAEQCMLEDEKYVSAQAHQDWKRQAAQIQEVIRFFKLTGINAEP